MRGVRLQAVRAIPLNRTLRCLAAFYPRDDDSAALQIAGDLHGVTRVIGKRGEVLVCDVPDLLSVIGDQYVLVTVADALLRALALVDFASMIAATLAVADDSRPRLLGAETRLRTDPADHDNRQRTNDCSSYRVPLHRAFYCCRIPVVFRLGT